MMSVTPADLSAMEEIKGDLDNYANVLLVADFLGAFNQYPTHHEPVNIVLRDIFSVIDG